MIRIELDTYEQKDLLDYLKYAIEQKEKNRPEPNPYLKGGSARFDTTNYDIMRIEQLMRQIERPRSRVSVYKSAQYDDCVSKSQRSMEANDE